MIFFNAKVRQVAVRSVSSRWVEEIAMCAWVRAEKIGLCSYPARSLRAQISVVGSRSRARSIFIDMKQLLIGQCCRSPSSWGCLVLAYEFYRKLHVQRWKHSVWMVPRTIAKWRIYFYKWFCVCCGYCMVFRAAVSGHFVGRIDSSEESPNQPRGFCYLHSCILKCLF